MSDITPTPQDLARMIDQSNQGTLTRINKLTCAISDQGVYTQQNIDFLKEATRQLQEARNNMLETIRHITEISKSHTMRLNKLEEIKPIKTSWLPALLSKLKRPKNV